MLVTVTEDAKAEIAILPFKIQERVGGVLVRLAAWPNVSGVKYLVGEWAGHARIRTGAYRVVFRIPVEEVNVVKVDDRKDVYGGKRSARSPARVRRNGSVAAIPFMARLLAGNARQARLDAGLSQTELARKLDVSQTMVMGVEKGRIRIGQRYINDLLKACGQPDDYPVHRRVLRPKIIRGAGKRAASPRKRIR